MPHEISERLLRLFIPPSVLCFALLIAVVADPSLTVVELIRKTGLTGKSSIDTIIAIVTGITWILGLGFVIQSVTDITLRILIRSIARLTGKRHSHRSYWPEKEREQLMKQFDISDIGDFYKEAEWCEIYIGSRLPDYIRGRLEREWAFHYINANSAVAVSMVLLMIKPLHLDPAQWRYVTLFMMVVMFSVLSIINWYASWSFTHFSVRKFKHLKRGLFIDDPISHQHLRSKS